MSLILRCDLPRSLTTSELDGNFIYLERLFKGLTAAGNNTLSTDSVNSVILGGEENTIYRTEDSSIISGYNNCIANCAYFGCSDASQKFSSIIGGCSNIICDNSWSTGILSGDCNRIMRSSDFSTIVGGKNNDIVQDACCASIVAGSLNIIHCKSDGGTILGGYLNYLANYSYNSSIIGGSYNRVNLKNSNSIISGGLNNKIYQYSSNSSIQGGCYNYVLGSNGSNINGGLCNSIQMNSSNTFVASSNCSQISECSSFNTILSGKENVICQNSDYNAIISGGCNIINSNSIFSSIISGNNNCITQSSLSSIINGYNNCIICSNYSTIIGGYGLSLEGESNTVLVPKMKIGYIPNYNGYNILTSNGGVISYTTLYDLGLGECPGFIRINEITTITGYKNYSYGSTENSILGGTLNKICSGSNYTSIIGGSCNIISRSSNNTSIIGGKSSTIDYCASLSSIIGGSNNKVSYYACYSSIIGGSNNNICFSGRSVIIGGNNLSLYGENDLVLVQKLRIDEITENQTDSKLITTDSSGNINYRTISSVVNPGLENYKSEDSLYSNNISGEYNTICSSSISSSILTGAENSIYYANRSSIVSGQRNTIDSSNESVIIGGEYNTIYLNSECSTIVGGNYNCISYFSGYSSIIGGVCNSIKMSARSLILGGNNLSLCEEDDVVLVSRLKISNLPDATDSRILTADSYGNVTYRDISTIGGGGGGSYIEVNASVAITGKTNTVTGDSCNVAIIGGQENCIYCSPHSVIMGSKCSLVDSNSLYSSISGSYLSSVVKSSASSISGTIISSVINSSNSSIIGGCCNFINSNSQRSSISGGFCNYISCYSNISSISNSRNSRICQYSSRSSILSGEDALIYCSSYGSIINSRGARICNSVDSTIINARSGEISIGSCYSSIVNGTELKIYCSCHSLISGRQNAICNSNYTFLFSQQSYIGGKSHHSFIGGGMDNRICTNSSCSSIIGGYGNTICNSKNSVIIGGCEVLLDSQNDVVYVPSLMSGTVSATQSATWKFGKQVTLCNLTMCDQQYLEVSVDGVAYKLAIIA